MICWSCNKVKGKRVCPARGGELICSRCCGTKRRVEIHCPEDCPYLDGAHDRKWRSARQLQEEENFFSRFVRLTDVQAGLVFFLHHVLVEASQRFSRLSDDELADVLETVTKTMETQSKGVLYHHQAESALNQPLVEWLVAVLAQRKAIEAVPDAPDSEVVTALGVVGRAVKSHKESIASRATYLEESKRFLAPMLDQAPALELPKGLDEAPSPGGMILPP